MKNSYIFLSILSISIMLFSGCSRVFSVGKENTYCREHGCSYVDVGICANPVDILQNKDNLEDLNNKSLIRKGK